MNKKEIRTDRIAGILALLLLIGAWFIGFKKNQDLLESRIAELRTSQTVVESTGNIFFLQNQTDSSMSYACVGSGQGYGGTLSLCVGINTEYEIEELLIIDHKETPSFIKRLNRRNYLRDFNHISIIPEQDSLILPDAMTGATFTSHAIRDAILDATGEFRTDQLHLDGWPAQKAPLDWQVRHLILLLVMLLAWVSTLRWFPKKKISRWVLLLFNLGFLGFWLGNQLSVSQISRLLSGDFPPLQAHLFFYLLLGGTIILILLFNKNLYFDRICPFGAAQECINNIGGAKVQLTRKRAWLRWIPRLLALALIILALLFRNPTKFNHEVFSTFFKLIGTSFQFGLLILVLISSLFLIRPWCNLLCPVKPVFDWIRMVRNWIKLR